MERSHAESRDLKGGALCGVNVFTRNGDRVVLQKKLTHIVPDAEVKCRRCLKMLTALPELPQAKPAPFGSEHLKTYTIVVPLNLTRVFEVEALNEKTAYAFLFGYLNDNETQGTVTVLDDGEGRGVDDNMEHWVVGDVQ